MSCLWRARDTQEENGSTTNVCAFCRLENRDTASEFYMRAVIALPEDEVFETNNREAVVADFSVRRGRRSVDERRFRKENPQTVD